MRLQFLWLSVISSFVFTSPPLFAQEDCYLKAIDWIRQDTLVRRLVTTYLRVDGVSFCKAAAILRIRHPRTNRWLATIR